MHRSSRKSVVISFLLGTVTGPVLVPIVKPYLREAAKGTIRAGFTVRRLAQEATEDLEDLAAEAGAEFAASDRSNGASASKSRKKP